MTATCLLEYVSRACNEDEPRALTIFLATREIKGVEMPPGTSADVVGVADLPALRVRHNDRRN